MFKCFNFCEGEEEIIMSQSCETLITKINEWQKAIFELEKLADEFLNTGDDKLKLEIDTIRQEIKKITEEYQKLAYPELPNGKPLFWLEKELLETLFKNFNKKLAKYPYIINIKNKHLIDIGFDIGGIPKNQLNLSLFYRLEHFYFTRDAMLKKFPVLPLSIKSIRIEDNPNIKKIPNDLSVFNNLEEFAMYNCDLEKMPILPDSVEKIDISSNNRIKIPDDLSRLKNLKNFLAGNCELKKLPILPASIKEINVSHNYKIEMPDDLTHLKNLQELIVRNCRLEKTPKVNSNTKIITS